MSLFFVTCGPTGVGKTHQMRRLLERDPARYTPVLSVTTRASRGPEDDRWYRFLTRDDIDALPSEDILSDVEFRGERYVLLRSEIDAALARAPVALMAIVPRVIMRMRELGVPHVVCNCRIADDEEYRRRLEKRGYLDVALEHEWRMGREFAYPFSEEGWRVIDLSLCSPLSGEDNQAFDNLMLSYV